MGDGNKNPGLVDEVNEALGQHAQKVVQGLGFDIENIEDSFNLCWADGKRCPYRRSSFWGPILSPDVFHCSDCGIKISGIASDLAEIAANFVKIMNSDAILVRQDEVVKNTQEAIITALHNKIDKDSSDEFEKIANAFISFIDELKLSTDAEGLVTIKQD